MKITICPASPEDAGEILSVYAPYVMETAVTYEYEVPSVEEFRGRMERTLSFYPYLKAVSGGRILGYAYAGRFHPRAAYDWSAETSVYVARDVRRCGIGGLLYAELERYLKAQGILNLYACIAVPDDREDEYLTRDSVRFHERLGYRQAGEFPRCASKFGRWYGMVWMEKCIGAHTENPLPVRPLTEVKEIL